MDYKKETIKSYDKNAKDLSKKFKELMDLKRRYEFPRFVSLLKGKKILDLGCGSGDHSLYFKKRGLDVVSVDLSKEMINLCKEKGLNALVMDIEDLDFKDKSFDGIWAVTSLLHVQKSKLGKVIKTIFLCRYLQSEQLRQEIHEGLNVIERWNGVNNFIFYGRKGEICTNNKEEQEIIMLCLHLLQLSLVYINTLMLHSVLKRSEWQNVLTIEDKRDLTPLIHEHINPYGIFLLDMKRKIIF